MGIVFKNHEAEARIERTSERILKTSRVPFEEVTLHTSFGRTNIVRSPAHLTKRPLIILHGGSGNAAITAWLFEDLARSFNLIVPDIIGGTGKSEEKFLNPMTSEHGTWLAEVVDGMSLAEVNILAISQGAFPALRYLEAIDRRLDRLVLYVPAGFVTARLLSTLFRFFLPLMLFRVFRFDFLYNFIEKNIFTGLPDPLISDYFREVFANTRFDSRLPQAPGRVSPAKGVKALVVSAANDLFFSGARLQNKARDYFGAEVQTILLENSNHSLNKGQDQFNALIKDLSNFLEG